MYADGRNIEFFLRDPSANCQRAQHQQRAARFIALGDRSVGRVDDARDGVCPRSEASHWAPETRLGRKFLEFRFSAKLDEFAVLALGDPAMGRGEDDADVMTTSAQSIADGD